MADPINVKTTPSTQNDSSLAIRCLAGGVLMGLANLVPGISGGTMLLASGIYPRFIESIAELSSFRFNKRALVVLGLVVSAAALAILLLAGIVKSAVIDHRWVMYSLFIGLTLGGLSVIWSMARPVTPNFWFGASVGIAIMVALAWMQMSGDTTAATRQGWFIMFVAGVAGASAMILPGVSGGYLLLVLGVYVPVLGAIDRFKDALKSMDIAAAMGPAVDVILPVGLGVLVGVLVVSNLIKVVLHKYEQATLGILMGFLVGAVFGLWPFQRGMPPKVGELFKGEIVSAESLSTIAPEKFPTAFYSPTITDVAMATGLVFVGFVLTTLIARWGNDSNSGSI